MDPQVLPTPVTTDSNHKFNIAPNLLDRNFSTDQPNKKWAGDITYIWTCEGWLYLAVILDYIHSVSLVGPLSSILRIDCRAVDGLIALALVTNYFPPQVCRSSRAGL